jgi:lysophospholipase L1-like esterase
MRSILGRVALALAATIVGLVLLEGLLQAASLFVSNERRGVDPSTGHVRVLCLGDSNTYGLSVERNETWPAQLEARWKSGPPRPGIEVLNLGYPGTNSSQVLRDFERNLDLFEPRVVLVEVGANDFWTVPVPVDAKEPPSLLDRLRRGSRLYRLLYMATRSPEEMELVVDLGENQPFHAKGSFQYLGNTFELRHDAATATRPRVAEDLEGNLVALARIAGARGVKLAFVTYASGELLYAAAARQMKKAGAATNTTVIDIRPSFRDSVCKTEPCPEWLFEASSPHKHHPTARGYELVAEVVARELETILPASDEPADAR